MSLPEISHALGLGTMRVDSKLNEPLSAQIDIIGATAEELQAIRASVASPELFQRFNAERPAFLASATISVGSDAAGKPVLNVHSTGAFTEPLVEFLIDLRSGNERLVRDYALLLDPARIAPAIPANAAVIPDEASSVLVELPPVQVPNLVPEAMAIDSVAPANVVLASPPVATSPDTLYRVVTHDTLRAIARRAGARSDVDLQRMMLAIFQANQQAFAGNISLLHSGALIRIPSPAEIQIFDSVDVARELRAQMAVRRRGGRPAPRPVAAPFSTAESRPVVMRALPPQDIDRSAVLSALNKLDGQVQFLQQTLSETSRQLVDANTRISDMERHATQQPVVASPPTAERGKVVSSNVMLNATVGILALFAGLLAVAWRRLRSDRTLARKPVSVEEPTVEAPAPDIAAVDTVDAVDAMGAPDAAAGSEPGDPAATVEMVQVADIEVDTIEEPGPALADEPDTVVMESLEPSASDATGTVLDYNLADLDGRTQHVEMPGALHDDAVVVERRKNVVDALMAAIKRDPTRADLRMKLLETLYTAAASNLRIFKEVVRDLARHPERLRQEEWEHVMAMGRQIAPEDALFADPVTDSNVAECA